MQFYSSNILKAIYHLFSHKQCLLLKPGLDKCKHNLKQFQSNGMGMLCVNLGEECVRNMFLYLQRQAGWLCDAPKLHQPRLPQTVVRIVIILEALPVCHLSLYFSAQYFSLLSCLYLAQSKKQLTLLLPTYRTPSSMLTQSTHSRIFL